MSAPEIIYPPTVGGGTPVGGTGTTNTIPRWTGPSTLGDSVITQSGSFIGIGTASPAFRADIVGSPGNLMRVSCASSNTNPTLTAEPGINLKNTTSTNGVYASITNRDAAENANTQINFINVNQSGSGAINFVTRDSVSGQSERMRIDSSGNVGIGTPSPVSGGLTVYGASNGQVFVQNSSGYTRLLQNSTDFYIDGNVSGSAGNIVFRRASSTLESMRIDSSGNVGIGTASPGAQLHISRAGGTSNAEYIRLQNTTAAAGSAVGINFWQNNAATTVGRIEGTVTAGGSYDTAFYNWNGSALAEGMRLTGAGNVGIGTASPSTRLHVNAGNGIRVTDATGTAGFDMVNAGVTAYLYNRNNGSIVFGTNNLARATLTDTSLDLTATAGYGLKLPATPGNADPNTLDCYQENYASNSWTPVIFGGTTAGTATYSVQEGFYTRWGNLIFCTATVVFSGHTGTGNLSLSGLPFAAKTAGSGTYRSSIIIEEGGGVKAILRLQSGTTATTTGVSIAASGNYVITFVYATN